LPDTLVRQADSATAEGARCSADEITRLSKNGEGEGVGVLRPPSLAFSEP
jgi:hypothetical protein